LKKGTNVETILLKQICSWKCVIPHKQMVYLWSRHQATWENYKCSCCQ